MIASVIKATDHQPHQWHFSLLASSPLHYVIFHKSHSLPGVHVVILWQVHRYWVISVGLSNPTNHLLVWLVNFWVVPSTVAVIPSEGCTWSLVWSCVTEILLAGTCSSLYKQIKYFDFLLSSIRSNFSIFTAACLHVLY